MMRASQAVVVQLDLRERWLILDHPASQVLLEALDKDLQMTLNHLELLVLKKRPWVQWKPLGSRVPLRSPQGDMEVAGVPVDTSGSGQPALQGNFVHTAWIGAIVSQGPAGNVVVVTGPDDVLGPNKVFQMFKGLTEMQISWVLLVIWRSQAVVAQLNLMMKLDHSTSLVLLQTLHKLDQSVRQTTALPYYKAAGGRFMLFLPVSIRF